MNFMGSLLEDSGTKRRDIPPEMNALANRFIEGMSNGQSMDDVLSLVFYRIGGGMANELPTANLAEVQPVLTIMRANQEKAEFPAPRKSRPKKDN